LSENCGAVVLVPTSTSEAKAFKAANLYTPIDVPFIDDRERIFLDLNERFDRKVQAETSADHNVATTGSRLVTIVSHMLMRVMVGEERPAAVEGAVCGWIESDALKPDSIALVYAPDEIIRRRIQQRQESGDYTERFWGFNAPSFCRDIKTPGTVSWR
jgi:hypothetical protein